MAATLTGYKLFRHTSDISDQDYAWCEANATLLYSGAGLRYADTGLPADTTYYYKLFSVYNADGSTFYSNGVSASQATQAASNTGYQPWDNYPDSPVLTEDYPYQVILNFTHARFIGSKYEMLVQGGFIYNTSFAGNMASFYLVDGVWQLINYTTGGVSLGSNVPVEANSDIYTDASLSTVYFEKTTA